MAPVRPDAPVTLDSPSAAASPALSLHNLDRESVCSLLELLCSDVPTPSGPVAEAFQELIVIDEHVGQLPSFPCRRIPRLEGRQLLCLPASLRSSPSPQRHLPRCQLLFWHPHPRRCQSWLRLPLMCRLQLLFRHLPQPLGSCPRQPQHRLPRQLPMRLLRHLSMCWHLHKRCWPSLATALRQDQGLSQSLLQRLQARMHRHLLQQERRSQHQRPPWHKPMQSALTQNPRYAPFCFCSPPSPMLPRQWHALHSLWVGPVPQTQENFHDNFLSSLRLDHASSGMG